MAMKMRKKKNKVQAVVKKVTAQSARSIQANDQASSEAQVFNLPKTQYVEAVGRRKVATARVRVFGSEGDFVVNGKLASTYFQTVRNASAVYNKPFELTGTQGKLAVSATVSGSGINGQLAAVIHGLSRALVLHNPDFKIFLKSAGLLTRDDRMKETRKIGMGGKARRRRQSPKR
jgi:small subunit ribosomal protein S9